jgi:hypothetical protein
MNDRNKLVEEFIDQIYREDLSEEENYQNIIEHINSLNRLADVLITENLFTAGLAKGWGFLKKLILPGSVVGGSAAASAAASKVADGDAEAADKSMKYDISKHKRKYFTARQERSHEQSDERRRYLKRRNTSRKANLRNARSSRPSA